MIKFFDYNRLGQFIFSSDSISSEMTYYGPLRVCRKINNRKTFVCDSLIKYKFSSGIKTIQYRTEFFENKPQPWNLVFFRTREELMSFYSKVPHIKTMEEAKNGEYEPINRNSLQLLFEK